MCSKDEKLTEAESENDLKNLVRGFFDKETMGGMERLRNSEALKVQKKMSETVEAKMIKRNGIRVTVGEDKLMMKEVKEIAKMKHESSRMFDLCSRKRVELLRKRKREGFSAWKKEARKERKRMKRAEKSKDVRSFCASSESGCEESNEMISAVSWALDERRKKDGVG